MRLARGDDEVVKVLFCFTRLSFLSFLVSFLGSSLARSLFLSFSSDIDLLITYPFFFLFVRVLSPAAVALLLPLLDAVSLSRFLNSVRRSSSSSLPPPRLTPFPRPALFHDSDPAVFFSLSMRHLPFRR